MPWLVRSNFYACVGALDIQIARRVRLICGAGASKTPQDLRVARCRPCGVAGMDPDCFAVPVAVAAMLCVGSGESGVADIVRPISDRDSRHKLNND